MRFVHHVFAFGLLRGGSSLWYLGLNRLSKTKSEARRFITLIDTFYEHKIRVVASGYASYWELFQPENISEQERLEQNRVLIDDLGIKANDGGSLDAGVFTGAEELFAFDRTVSRLTEMQTKDYTKKWKNHQLNKGAVWPRVIHLCCRKCDKPSCDLVELKFKNVYIRCQIEAKRDYNFRASIS